MLFPWKFAFPSGWNYLRIHHHFWLQKLNFLLPPLTLSLYKKICPSQHTHTYAGRPTKLHLKSGTMSISIMQHTFKTIQRHKIQIGSINGGRSTILRSSAMLTHHFLWQPSQSHKIQNLQFTIVLKHFGDLFLTSRCIYKFTSMANVMETFDMNCYYFCFNK